MADPIAVQRVVYEQAPELGSVRVKAERNSRSINVEVSVDRPRQPGESFEECAKAAAELARLAYAEACKHFPPANGGAT